MSTPFGVDLGNANTVIACARNRGIDIIVNEVSNRSTPSIIGFGPRNRFIGETGKNQQTSNLKNTVENFKRFLGLPEDHPDIPVEKKYTTAELVSDPNSQTVGSQVNYLGSKTVFSSIQLSAMYLNKIKDITVKETKGNIQDICLAVPVWYTERQRRAAADACRIAGLNPVRIVNEVTAAAVSYGVFKANDLPEEDPRKVAFVDIGHSSLQVAVAAVKKGELKILGSGYDKNFGGRDFDHAIAQHFASEFKDKYKIDVNTNPKAYYRILSASEKLKKVLSANSSAPFGVESVMNDVDVSSSMTREQLEEYVQPLLNRIQVPIEVALKDAGLKAEDLDSVEVVGGCTRVPSLKAKLSEIFKQPLSFTLNQDEAVARGAAFICAMHSPTLRVRPFKFEDFNPYSVSYFWDKEDDDEDHLEVFPRGGLFPSTKLITLYRSGDTNIEAKYTNAEELPKGTEAVIGKWELKGIVPSDGEKSIATKIKLRNDPSGFYTIESAYTVEDKLVKELVEKEAKPESEKKEEGEDDAEVDEEPEYREVKKTVKKNDVTIVSHTSALLDDARDKLEQQENTMTAEDKLVADTEDRKNALEEYIYDLRGKLDEQYKDFASEAEKEKLSGMLLKTEDWLYDEGYDSTKAKYIAKYEELASLGNLIRGRYLAKEEERKQNLRSKQEQEKTAKLAEEMAKNRKEPKQADDVEMKE